MNVKLWIVALGLLVANAFIWFSLTPAFYQTTDILNGTFGQDIAIPEAKAVFDKILRVGREDFQLLIIVADIAVILWAFMTHQQEQRYTGRYQGRYN